MRHKQDTCIEGGCNQPVGVDRNGKPYRRCAEHQQAYRKRNNDAYWQRLRTRLSDAPAAVEAVQAQAVEVRREPTSAPDTKLLVVDLRRNCAEAYEATRLAIEAEAVPVEAEAYAAFLRQARDAGYQIVIEE